MIAVGPKECQGRLTEPEAVATWSQHPIHAPPILNANIECLVPVARYRFWFCVVGSSASQALPRSGFSLACLTTSHLPHYHGSVHRAQPGTAPLHPSKQCFSFDFTRVITLTLLPAIAEND